MESCPRCKKIFPISHSFCPICGSDLRKQKISEGELEEKKLSYDSSVNTKTENNSLFSINGTIGRGTYLFHFVVYIFFNILFKSIAEDFTDESIILFIILIQVLLFVYFLFQGKRRCHDIGESGWWQLVPFYTFFMLFIPGNYSLSNKYRNKT